MKALVLCGGIPQITLIKQLKDRGITTILADMNENAPARKYADIFYPVSTLDVEGIKSLAEKESVDFLITVCADQVLQVVAQVSEILGLPCYIDYKTAENVSKKSYMKKIFIKSGVPTSQYVITDELNEESISNLKYPLIVKPIDSYSSRGVRKVNNFNELAQAFEEAKKISRTGNAIIEEFVSGNELTVDAYIEDGTAHILCISNLSKVNDSTRFVIHRSEYPAQISDNVKRQIKETAQKIAEGFGLKNSPLLIQLINTGDKISVIEFCARTGGGVKYAMIKRVTGFDVVKAVIDLTLGLKPHVEEYNGTQKYIINEFFYCTSGTFDHLEGFEELLEDNIISEYHQLKKSGFEFTEIKSSGDRVACYTIETTDFDDLRKRHRLANQKVKAVDISGKDLIKHEIAEQFEYDLVTGDN